MTEKDQSRCPERSAFNLPCTRKRGHQSEPYGALCMSSDGQAWTNDPWAGRTPGGESRG